MIYTVCQNNEKWCTFSFKTGPVEWDPEEIHAFFIDTIDASEDTYIFVRNLDNYIIDILRVIKTLDLSDVTAEEVPKKKMKNFTYSYLVSNDGKAFSVTIKYVDAIIEIRNFELLVPIKNDEELLELYPTGNFGLPGVCAAMMSAVVDIGGLLKSEKIPLTISSLSLKAWESSYNKYDFYLNFKNADTEEVFDCTLDEYIRPAYFGGWCYLNYEKPRIYKDVKGCTLDVNSLYSYVMYNKPLPYGKPYTFTKKIPDVVERLSREGFIYYYIRVKCNFEIKPGHFPCIQIPDSFLYTRDWLETSHIFEGYRKSKKPTLTLTMTDYQLLLEHYNVTDLEIIDGVYFRSTTKLYNGFVDRFYTMKKRAKTPGQRKIAKTVLNALSGNMSKRRERINMIIDTDSENIFVDQIKSKVNGISHIQIGAAITAYARKYIIDAAHANAEYFVYSDTDSLHLDCDVSKARVPISGELGDFKIEMEWNEAIFFTKKVYAERNMHPGGPVRASFKCAGLDREITEMIEAMLTGKSAKRPDGISVQDFVKLRAQVMIGVEALSIIRIPYTEKHYSNFLYTTELKEFKLGFSKKPPKTIKLL